MSTSRRILALLVVGTLAALAAHCSAGGECLRYSDCADGLTCTDGRCVAPAAEAGEEAETDGGDASSADGAPDAGSDSEPTADAATHDGGASTDAAADARDCTDGGCPGDGSASADARTDAGAPADASSD